MTERLKHTRLPANYYPIERCPTGYLYLLMGWRREVRHPGRKRGCCKGFYESRKLPSRNSGGLGGRPDFSGGNLEGDFCKRFWKSGGLGSALEGIHQFSRGNLEGDSWSRNGAVYVIFDLVCQFEQMQYNDGMEPALKIDRAALKRGSAE